MLEEGRHPGAKVGALVLSLEQNRLRQALPLVVRRAMGFTARHRFDDMLLMAVRDYYGLDLDLSGVEHEILDDDDERIRFLPWFLWDWRSTGDEPTVGEQFLVTCEHTSLDERLLQGLCDSYVGFFLALETASRDGVWLQDMTSGRRIRLADEGLEGELFEGQILQARLVEVESGGDRHILVDAVYAILPAQAREPIESEIRSLLTPGSDPVVEMKAAANELIEFSEHILESLSRPPKLGTTEGAPMLLCQTSVRSDDVGPLVASAVASDQVALEPVSDTVFVWSQQDRAMGFIAQDSAERWILGALSHEAYEEMRETVDPEGRLAIPFYSLTDVEAVAERWVTSGGGERWLGLFPEVEGALRLWVGAWTLGWADRPVSVLGHRTPREAMRRSEGRRQVERLVQEFETSHHAWFDGCDADDFTGLRRELGLA